MLEKRKYSHECHSEKKSEYESDEECEGIQEILFYEWQELVLTFVFFTIVSSYS